MGYILSEAEFQRQIIDLAHLRGWLVHAERKAWSQKGWRTPIQGDAGFLDLVLVRKGILIIAELKVEHRLLSLAQSIWYEALKLVETRAMQVRQTIDLLEYPIRIYKWTPSDWEEIERILK